MTNLARTIIPKSDQLNADDLIGKSKTIKITAVSVKESTEQPVAISFEGDGGKPYKPGLSMRRVLIRAWGEESSDYIGRSMRLFRDDKVQYGGEPVGGIRISHLSDIPRDVSLPLTVTRKNRKLFTVQPLPKDDQSAPQPTQPLPQKASLDEAEVARLVVMGDEAAAHGTEASDDFWGGLTEAERSAVKPNVKRWVARAKEVDAKKAAKPDSMEASDAA